jgi:carboxymethylenebutenolidase
MQDFLSVMKAVFLIIALGCLADLDAEQAAEALKEPEVVHFQNQGVALGGELFKPKGEGPFPAILYNHGSAPGMLNSQASKSIGPLFAEKGWVFFMPYRRGQGLSSRAGPYIGDQIAEAQRLGGMKEGAATMIRLLNGEHLQDQLAALQWLKSQKFVQGSQIAAAGNSFGGIEAVLGAAHAQYCAAIDASGGAESWSIAPDLQALMKETVRKSNAPIFFFQAENDFDLAPSKELFAEMKLGGKEGEFKIYPPYGASKRDGHSFAYMGSATWFSDVFAFVQKHCMQSTKTANKPGAADR